MAEKQDNVLIEEDNASKNGEENFKEEIKDYAKTTMNELLGMFGYDDEITSESVDSLDIKVPSSADEPKVTTTAAAPKAVMTTAGMSPTPATTTSVAMTTTPPSLPAVEDLSSDTPIIVKVEGNTSVSDIIQQQNSVAATTTPPLISRTPDPPSSEANKVIQPTTPAQSTATTVSQSTAVQPALAPHFYAVPPAVRGLYCVVANLPLVVNQNKSAMTFKFWNCITCSEYFLQKPEVVFRVQYPHLFNGQPDWLYQAAVCAKCYHNLVNTVEPRTNIIPENQSKATFKVIDCKLEDKDGTGPSADSVCVSNIVAKEVTVTTTVTQESEREQPSANEGKNTEDPGLADSSPHDEEASEDTESTEESPENRESYKCYVCSISVSKTSRHGKLRRSKFPSLFLDVADNVGHFKVCHTCFDRLNRQRDRYIQANIADDQRDYLAHIKVWTGVDAIATARSCSSYSTNVCFVCERILNESKDPSRPIFRSRYPSLFRSLPDHVIHLPICDKCYKKLQKVKLRYDNGQQDEDQRDYIQFINMWRAKKGLGKHAVLV